MATLQILTKNNEETIKNTLESIKNLGFKIIIGDLGSTDSTLSICSDYNVEIIKLKLESDYSKARNELIREGINFYIEPWEVLIQGHDKIKELESSSIFYILNEKFVSKEIRLWENKKFENPVYETISDKNAKCFPDVVILSSNPPDKRKERIEICKKWLQANPTRPEPYYYLSCSYLADKQLKEFKSTARKYLAINRDLDMSSVLIYYYLAQVGLYTNELQESVKSVLTCIAFHPTFSEFWCVLGDLLYKQGNYEKAKQIYKNAIIIGKRRLNDDNFSIEIAKYEEYPQKMINNIDNLEKEFSLIGSERHK
jgi:tetratricopeptide (TPR) repeat protein